MTSADWQIQNIWLGLGITLAVFGLYYAVAMINNKKTANATDLYLAGRSIGPLVNSLAASSTWMSVATFLGVVALIQQLHLPFVYMWIQLILSVPLLVMLYGASLYRMGVFTSVHFVQLRYGRNTAFLAAGWMLLIMLMYMVGQFIGIAKVFEVLLGLPYTPSLILSALVITGYITIGGMKGATYNDAIQMVIMMIALLVPLAAILKAMGVAGYWVPPLGYGDLTDALLEQIPTFFDLKFEARFYLSLFVALTIGTLGLPQLAQRVLTSENIKSARVVVPWFCLWVGLMFLGTYAMGFAGVYHFAMMGQELTPEAADKTTLLLNLAYNPEWVSAFVIAGVLAAGVSTIAGLMIGVATVVGHDIVGVLRPHMSEKQQLRYGYMALAGTGVVSLLVSLDPPAFLITSIFWAFGLCATAITPMVVLGVWSTRINPWGAFVGSLLSGALYILLSPYVFADLVVGSGLVAGLGFSTSLISVPVGFILTILVSLATERFARGKAEVARSRAQELVEGMHGWATVTRQRYDSSQWLLILAALWAPVLLWGLVPW
ncbi:sodium:solute symporter family protein [Profundibacterium mesophilum]|uniref:Sodiumproline symporter n=1 Tax=Profundibacterium mesophilum KAUST100406-0324 TaxID=1037889 RepID=A0A921P0T0_9RHOB|nr:sodium:solute symporter [Profundibacterium mesophilum]KAF0677108.1 Sodiumproline symporter [Profundibacterium mesophilum KAUST100406-0324]